MFLMIIIKLWHIDEDNIQRLYRITDMTLTTYVKLSCKEDIEAGVKALERLAIDEPTVCIMDVFIMKAPNKLESQEEVRDYFEPQTYISPERCANIVSNRVEIWGNMISILSGWRSLRIDKVRCWKNGVREKLTSIGYRVEIHTKED
jgi:hypothetical protein